ncbi:Cu-Zn family superoxide dismutase [Novosphingobium hassiacum]|uniref:Cu-Zn family superoxide dismutase n=1 Tax=Novosphingobium hassiacum TaxID=173676 RepID=A0A7W6A1C1_9SPHN|nr:superoxide dismutase family protein [Novosphingobium hassiacum]MBB3862394.1 Cu-Zn family superoxide dismutase [Novosphingobium hassiacum]
MKMNLSMISLAAISALSGCSTMSGSETGDAALLARSTLSDAAGRGVGSAEITRTGSTLYLSASVTGQGAGDHGIHFHAVGKCEAPGFTTAGGHLNPSAHQHGNLNPAGPHLGDLPNMTVAADGSGSLKAPLIGVPADLIAAMFDADGTAIVFHAGPDDYKTDPSGNSGGRLACGVLERLAD